MKIKYFIYSIFCLCLSVPSFAQSDLKFKFRSRGLFDASISGYGKDKAQGFYKMEDLRIGFKATYNDLEITADAGLTDSKVTIKDLTLNYNMDNHIFSLGNTYEPFSLDMMTSTAEIKFHQAAGASQAFADSRKLGFTYHYHIPCLYFGSGIYTHNDINNLGKEQKNAFITTSRGVLRKQSGSNLFHFGGAFSFRSRESNTLSPVASIQNVGVTSLFDEYVQNVTIENMGSEVKGMLEFICQTSKIMLQGEYFLDRMNRRYGAEAYRAHGGYIQGSYLLRGEGFNYDESSALPGRPSSNKAVELVTRFNYTNLNDKSAGIFGGEEKDISLGVNAYFNSFLSAKLNASYMWTDSRCCEFYGKDLFLVQARLQYIF